MQNAEQAMHMVMNEALEKQDGAHEPECKPRHSCRTLLWDTLVGHSCRKLLWDTLGTLLWDTLVGHSCGILIRDTLVAHSCRTLLRGKLLSDTL